MHLRSATGTSHRLLDAADDFRLGGHEKYVHLNDRWYLLQIS